MSKPKKLISDLVFAEIDRILDNMKLPSDAPAALTIVSALARDYKNWQKLNSEFVKKNKKTVINCEKDLSAIINGYKDIQRDMTSSKNLDEDCATDGPIYDKMEGVSEQLHDFQGRFDRILTYAEDYQNAKEINK